MLACKSSIPRQSRGNVSSLFRAQIDLDIDEHTTVPDWFGDRPDYDHIVWVMKPDAHAPV